ncbi:hypothetical protein OF83DRAFT_1106955 [Amylostereum chailletii]|nr:hypothetical protein OF83DRAFT_1106955 [Amylostereum chailletii]
MPVPSEHDPPDLFPSCVHPCRPPPDRRQSESPASPSPTPLTFISSSASVLCLLCPASSTFPEQKSTPRSP